MRGAERTRHVPIIFVTAAFARTAAGVPGLPFGRGDFLFKPIEPQILRHRRGVFHRALPPAAGARRDLASERGVDGCGRPRPAQPAQRDPDDRQRQSGADDQRGHSGRSRAAALERQAHAADHRRTVRPQPGAARRRHPDRAPAGGSSADRAAAVAEVEATLPTRDRAGRTRATEQGNGTAADWSGLSNLIGNALQHGDGTPRCRSVRGRERARGRFGAQRGAIAARCCHGSSIRSARHRRRARAEGLGLGLYIVQQLVIAHGGTVTVDSTEAEGTTFRVELPKR